MEVVSGAHQQDLCESLPPQFIYFNIITSTIFGGEIHISVVGSGKIILTVKLVCVDVLQRR